MTGGWDNWELIKLYDFPCLSYKEASIEEKKCCIKNNSKLNIQNPHRTEKELKDFYKTDKSKEYKKEYYQKNKEKIYENHKIYQQTYQKKRYNEQSKIKVNCPHCNLILNKPSLYNHIKDSCKEFKKQLC